MRLLNETGRSRRTTREHLRVRLMLALVILGTARLGFASLAYLRPGLALANDTDRYVPIANGILAGSAYGWKTEHPGEILNTIGYPLFLAGVFSTFGNEAGDIALAQLAATGALAIAMYAALSKWIGPVRGFVAALLLLLDPLTTLWSMTILTESLFAVFLGLGVVMLLVWDRSGMELPLLFAGIFIAMACLVKPFAILVVAVWAALVVLRSWKAGARPGKERRGKLRTVLIFVLPSILLITPWVARNALLWDCPTLSSVDRVTMRDYMAAKVMVESQGIELETAQSILQSEDPGVCPSLTSKYLGIILGNPAIYARLHVAGTIPVLIGTDFDRWLQYFGVDYALPDLWRPYMDGGFGGLVRVMAKELHVFPQGLGVMFAMIAYQLLLYGLACIGVLRRTTEVSSWFVAALVIAILILVLAPGQGGHERFRVGIQPMLCILAAFGIPGLGRLFAGGRGSRLGQKITASLGCTAA